MSNQNGSKVVEILNNDGSGRKRVVFWCPGCKCHHGVPFEDDGKVAWSWNRSYTSPTIHPSILIDYGDRPDRPKRCHLFVREGKLQFLGDCDHSYANKTVDLSAVDAEHIHEPALMGN